MTYRLKGFLSIDGEQSNVLSQTAAIGELSAISRTFAKDIWQLSDPADRRTTVEIFHSVSSATGVSQVPQEVSASIFAVVQWLYAQRWSTTQQITTQALLSLFTTAFNDTLSNIALDAVVVNHTGRWWPQKVSFTVRGFADADNVIAIWLSDSKFQSQYDEYEYAFIAPIGFSHLDDFFAPAQTVVNKLASVNPSALISAINNARPTSRETRLVPKEIHYEDPQGVQADTMSSWIILVYGNRGLDPDLIRQGLRQWVLANSTHSENDWKTIFPDLFRNTEFLIFPKWSSVAVPFQTLTAGVYSAVTSLSQQLSWLKSLDLDLTFTDAFIDANAQVLSLPFSSLQAVIIANPDNKNSWFSITDVFPDLTSVPLTSTDFSRQAEDTREFLYRQAEALVAAQQATADTVGTSNWSLTQRYGMTFVQFPYKGIDFLYSTAATTP